MYPTYWLEVYCGVQHRWVDVAAPGRSNAPHHYDAVEAQFQRLVKAAKGGSRNQAPLGYRIMAERNRVTGVVQAWANGPAAREGAANDG